jgi:hypothetical protein
MLDLVKQDPDNAEWLVELGLAYERHGYLLMAKGDLTNCAAVILGPACHTGRIIQAQHPARMARRVRSVSATAVSARE